MQCHIVNNIKDEVLMREKFLEDLNICLASWSFHNNIKDIDMFFFPTHYAKHFFVFCINVKLNKYEVLDNSLNGANSQYALEKYGLIPKYLVKTIYSSMCIMTYSVCLYDVKPMLCMFF